MSKFLKGYLTNQVHKATYTPRTKKGGSNKVYIAFFLRKSESTKPEHQNKVSVVIRLTFKTKVKLFATGIICDREDFDRPTITVKNQPNETLLLRDLVARLNATFAEIRLTGRATTVGPLPRRWQG